MGQPNFVGLMVRVKGQAAGVKVGLLARPV